eukprot:jgi/Galph1/2446/GphlegSOOS_G1109.1
MIRTLLLRVALKNGWYPVGNFCIRTMCAGPSAPETIVSSPTGCFLPKRQKSNTRKGRGDSFSNKPSSSSDIGSEGGHAASSASPPARVETDETHMNWETVHKRFEELQAKVPGASLPVFEHYENGCSVTIPVRNRIRRFTLVLYFAEKAIETGLLLRAHDLDITFRASTRNAASVAVRSTFRVDIWGEENELYPSSIRFEKEAPFLLRKELDILLNVYDACHSNEAFTTVTNLDIYDTLGKYLQRLESKVYHFVPNQKNKAKYEEEEEEDYMDSSDRLEKLERKVTRYGASLYHPEQSLSWDMLAGYEEQKKKIEESIVLPLLHPDIFEHVSRSVRKFYRSPLPKAVLIEGPPGTGKTTVARVLASRGNIPLVHLTMESITSKWYGDSEKKLAKLLQVCNDYGPCFVFLDEIDSFLSDRTSMHEATRRTFSVLLRHLDGLTSESKSVLIAATNRKGDLDAALLSRFDEIITFELPDIDTRAEIIHLYAYHLTRNDSYTLASIGKDFSGRTISDACKEVERYWAARIVREEKQEYDLPPVEEYIKVFSRRANATQVVSSTSFPKDTLKTLE